MSDDQLITTSLHRVAEALGDPADAIYQQYFASCPDSAGLMGHLDTYVRGRMLAEVMHLLMSPQTRPQGLYLDFEVKTHRAYGVLPKMYGKLLYAVRDTVRSVLADEWNTDFEAAWQHRIEELLARIDEYFRKAAHQESPGR